MPYKDKLKQKESHHRWHLLNRERNQQQQRIYRLKNKLTVFGHYSDQHIQCACCGERELIFLSIDHINGGGRQHRASIGGQGLYLWLIQNNFPPGYRVLCHNCNQAYGFYGYCPHKSKNS